MIVELRRPSYVIITPSSGSSRHSKRMLFSTSRFRLTVLCFCKSKTGIPIRYYDVQHILIPELPVSLVTNFTTCSRLRWVFVKLHSGVVVAPSSGSSRLSTYIVSSTRVFRLLQKFCSMIYNHANSSLAIQVFQAPLN